MFSYSYFGRGHFSLHYWGTWPTYPHSVAEPEGSTASRRRYRRYFIR